MNNDIFSHHSFLEELPQGVSLQKWQKLVDLIARIYHSSGAWLMQANEHGIEAIVASKGTDHTYPAGYCVKKDIHIYCQEVINNNQKLYVPNAEIGDNWRNNPEFVGDGYASYLGVPVCWPDGSVFGTLCTLERKQTDYSDDFIELINQLKLVIEADLLSLQQIQLLSDISIKDESTGLYNRRGLRILFEEKLANAKRQELNVTAAYFDLDNLKSVNDRHGHLLGDLYIKHFSTTLTKTLRDEDLLCRIGGDEFLVIMLQNHGYDKNTLLKRLYDSFYKFLPAELTALRPGFSMGYKEYSIFQPLDINSIMKETDALMYKAKILKKKKVV
ncbi:MAG: sensor domain-containing diguanylate cyclase [Bermanella sp.]